MQQPGLTPHYQIFVDRVGSLDILEVQVEMSPEAFSDEIKQLEKLQKRIREEMQSYLGVSAKISLMEPKTIQRSEGKAVRVVDRRKI